MAAPPPAYDYGAYAPQLGGPPAGSPSGSHLHGAPPVAAPPSHYHHHAPPPAYGAPPPAYYPPAYGSAPPPHHAPPPAYPGSYPGYPPGPSPYEAPASSDELRTVFVTGFPAGELASSRESPSGSAHAHARFRCVPWHAQHEHDDDESFTSGSGPYRTAEI
eukprot:365846-Chlamydomonas_euryale.AAC.6